MKRTPTSLVCLFASALLALGCGVGTLEADDGLDDLGEEQSALSIPLGNLTSNPSFESNTNGWYAWQGGLRRVQASSSPHGAYVVKVERVTGSSYSLSDNPDTVSSTSAGDTYDAVAYVRGNSRTAGVKKVQITIRERAPGGQIVQSKSSAPVALPNFYQKLTTSLTASGSGNMLDVFVIQSNAVSGDAFYADLITLIRRPVAPALDTRIDSAPPGTTSDTSATFAFSANVAGARFECRLDTASFAACASPVTYHQLAAGSHRFEVRALGTDGSIDSTPAVHLWSISTLTQPTTPPPGTFRTVSTFNSIGLYWTVSGGSPTTVATVRYRSSGETAWHNALPLWFDERNREYRGSVVHLRAGTRYEFELALVGTTTKGVIAASTWSESFPIAKTVTLPAGTSSTELVIRESGTPAGYILYTAAPGTQATIDMRNQGTNCITVYGSYVIIRGLRLTGCRQNGIGLMDGSHDIVIEENDISQWGESRDGGTLGVDRHAAVHCSQWQTPEEAKTSRVIIQRNKMHHPRYTTNSWNTGHPAGPHAITMNVCGENHVIRYNDIYGDDTHYFNDAMGGASNSSDKGFPRADSDIYGNRISHVWDDGIEAEGANRNVRIWGNRFDRIYMSLGIRTTNIGPLFIWRNVSGRSHYDETLTPDQDNHGSFLKCGSASTEFPAVGKTYLFHNTLLQPKDPAWSRLLGHRKGINDNGTELFNLMSRNNIFHVWSDSQTSIGNDNLSPTNSFDYDLFNGLTKLASGQETHGIRGTPLYRSDNGPDAFALSEASPGFDAAEVLPNFNDGYTGARPDIGAHEAGTPPMEFGVEAYRP